FIAGMDLIEAHVSGDRVLLGDGSVQCWWPGLVDFARVVVGLRPDTVALGDDGISGVVDHVEFMGDHYLIHVAVGDRILRVESPTQAQGDVALVINPQTIHLFDPATGGSLMHPM
ncbi:MAG: TOBE domain-containing protein, partial [Acidimicrobiia bacterium]|nr:TOBE domain-containing protein [Acidimicrobiia bacterium]